MAEQDYAQIKGECVVQDIGTERAATLADVIRQQPVTGTTGWGEPIVEGGTVRAMLRRGPMKGAWPYDLRRTLLKVMAQAEVGGVSDVRSTNRTVLAPGDQPAVTPQPAPAPKDGIEDNYNTVTVHHMSAEQVAAWEKMGRPETANFPEPLLVRVGDEVHAIYPDGKVQGPKDGTPR
jgi:hypothetical protein